MSRHTDTTKVTRKTTRYELEGELGRGGMAVVHAARDREMQRRVALKVLAAHLAGDAEFRARFLRESRIAASLSHRNLVRVYDVTEVDGLPAIVMELVDGPTLDGGSLTLEEAAQVADALAYAHERGVVHRDLKPGNLLRGADGVVKIGDFGIARAAEETRVTQIGTVLGTLRYLAPEQAAGSDVGPEADVYSLAVVLDELLEEKPPAVRALLDRARSIEPYRRPSAAAIAETLRAPRVYVQHRWLPVAAVVAVLVALALLIAVLALTRPSSKPAPPPRVAPVARSTDAAQQAQYLVRWVRRYSGR